MSDLGSQPYEPNDAQSARGRPSAGESYRSLLRLVIGLALAGGDDLFARLREWEAANSAEQTAAGSRGDLEPGSTVGLASRAVIGLTFEAVDVAGHLVSRALDATNSVTGAVRSAFRPVSDSALFRPVRSSARTVAARGEARFQQILRTGAVEQRRSRRLAEDVTGLLLEDLVGYAGENPGVKSLVDAQVDRLLPSLVTEPTIQELLVEQLGEWLAGLTTRPESLDPLVRQLGDRYIAYLNEHPEDVQNLVQGQAVGMAGEMRDRVRTITVTGDTLLETLARGLLRRAPRDQLPPPPAHLQSRNGSLPSGTNSQDGAQ